MLVRPSDEVGLLTEVFNRLQGELRMRGFEPLLATATGAVSLSEMKTITVDAQAQACVAFESKEGQSTVHVWFVDKQSELGEAHSFSAAAEPDSATVLPLRTVELLGSAVLVRRDSARAEGRAVPNASAARGVSPALAPGPARLVPHRFRLRGSVDAEWGSLAFGPNLSVGASMAVRLTPRWSIGVTGAFPLTDSRVRTEHATARLRLSRVFAEVSVRHWLLPERFWFEPSAGLGVAYLQATADVDESLISVDSSGWVANGLAGVGLWAVLWERTFVGGQARVGVVAPKTHVQVDTRKITVGRPAVSAGLGAGFEF